MQWNNKQTEIQEFVCFLLLWPEGCKAQLSPELIGFLDLLVLPTSVAVWATALFVVITLLFPVAPFPLPLSLVLFSVAALSVTIPVSFMPVPVTLILLAFPLSAVSDKHKMLLLLITFIQCYSPLSNTFHSHYTRMWFYMSEQLFTVRFLISTEVVYRQRWHGWCHMKLLLYWHVLCTPYNHAPCHFMQSHISYVRCMCI